MSTFTAETAVVDPDEPIDHVILTTDSKFAYTIADSYRHAVAKLQELRAREPERFAGATITTLDGYTAATEKAYLDDGILEIDADAFDYALDVLPPLAYGRTDGVERFCMREFTSGRITRQYARMDERYFSRNVRYGDESTYLTRDAITAALAAGAVRRAEAA